MSEATEYRTQNLILTKLENAWKVRDICNGKEVTFYIRAGNSLRFNPWAEGFHYEEALKAICDFMKNVKLCIVCNRDSKVEDIAKRTPTFIKVPTVGVTTRIYYSK